MKGFAQSALVVAITSVMTTAQAQDEFMLEEIVVTAQKRAESLQDVSVSVSALGTDFMRDAGVNDMNDVALHVPGLTVSTNASPWLTSFRVRRIGNEGNIQTFEPDTGLFIDGAFRSRSGLGLGDLVDVERIEVLKGPQSTLYGKNVTAGVISVSTVAPTQEFEAMAEGSVAEDSAYNVKSYINGGLSENVAGRLSMSYSERDHLVKNVGAAGDADDLQSYALRGQLMIDASEDLSIRLIAGIVDRDFDGPVGDVTWGPVGQAVFPALGAPINDNIAGNRKIDYGQGVTEFEQQSYEFTVIADYSLGSNSLTSITSYDAYDVRTNYKDVDQMGLDIISFDDTTEGYSWSQELRIASAGGETIDWMGGVFLYHNDFSRGDDSDQDFLLGADAPLLGQGLLAGPTGAFTQLVGVDLGPPFGVAIPDQATANALAAQALGQPGEYADTYNEQSTDTYGIFGSVTWNISEQMALTGGLRYSYEKKRAEIDNFSNATGLGALVGALPEGIIGRLVPSAGQQWKVSDSWNAITGNLNLEYHWTDNVMTYATIARGFKAGGFNLGWGTTAFDDRPFDEEKVDTLELGWKTRLLDNRLQLNGAIFYTEYTDFQSAAFRGLTFEVSNAEQVNNTGIEFDGLFLITEEITLNFAVSYVKAQYDKYTSGSCAYGVTPNGPQAGDGFCDLSGEDLPFAPRWKANTGIQYETAMWGGDFYSRLDVSWVDKHIPSSSLDPRHEQSDYALANVKLGWRYDNWDLSVWGKNITDQDYIIQAAPDYTLGELMQDGSYQVFMNTPASFGATIRYQY
jgi:outer membrane receptor protein involved in Fe transport